jgi:predicted ATP-grasp superfamily ATP-dependent carboligase
MQEMMKGKTALLVGADSCKTLPLAWALHGKGFWVVGLFVGRLNYGYSCRYVDERLIFRELLDCLAARPYLENLLLARHFDVVIPLEDACADLLSRMDTPGFPDKKAFDAGFQKQNLMRLCEQKGYPHPKTFFPEDGLPDNLPFPLLIKPDISSGARGISRVDGRDGLEKAIRETVSRFGPCHLQQLIPPGGRQVEVQLFVDANGRLVQHSVIEKHRWYPYKGGSSCCNVSRRGSSIVEVCHRILLDLHWKGFADFDTIEDPRTGELLVLELNPRLPACIKTAFVAGVDWGDVLSGEYMHLPHRSYEAREGEWLRFLGLDFLWFIHSPDRFRTTPCWFKFFGRRIHYQDMGMGFDPLPWFSGTLGNLLKLSDRSFRRKKAGMN